MAHRNIDIARIIPEEFKDTPFARDLAAVMQSVIVEPFIDNLNQLLLSRQAGDDVQLESVNVSNPDFQYQVKDPFERGTLLVMEQGIKLFQEADPTSTAATVDMVDAITGDINGSVNHDTRTVSMSIAGASPSNPVSVEVVYLTKYSMDAGTLDSLRQSLGLFIDTTGLTTEEDSRRLIEALPYYYETSHSKRFVQFLGYTANVLFTMKELYCRMNAYPEYGDKFTLEEVNDLGFSKWSHEIEAPRICACVVGQVDRKEFYGVEIDSLYISNDDTLLIEDDGRKIIVKHEEPEESENTNTQTDENNPVIGGGLLGLGLPSGGSSGPTRIKGGTTSTATWDYTNNSKMYVEFKLSEFSGEEPNSIEEEEVITFTIYVTNETRLVQQIELRAFASRSDVYFKNKAFPVPDGDPDNDPYQYSRTQTEFAFTSSFTRKDDVFGISLDRDTNSVMVFIKRADSNVIDTAGPFTNIPLLNGDYRAGVDVNLTTNDATILFRTNAQIEPCQTDIDPYKIEIPLPLNNYDWCGNHIGAYSEIPSDVWYKTSFVALEYDDEKFFENVPDYVNLFEKITQLFYQLAPIQLVLESIVARRNREKRFKIYGGYSKVEKQLIKTDTTTVTGVTPL